MEIVNFRKSSITYYSYILLFIVLFFFGLYHARSFLIPVALAVLFSMLLWPAAKFCERKGASRKWSSGICVFILLLFMLGLILFLVSQAAGFTSQMSSIQQQFTAMLDQVKNFLESKLGIDIGQVLGNNSNSSNQQGGNMGGFDITSYLSGFLSGLKSIAMGTVAAIIGIIVVLVYVFLMLLYRHVFINFIRKISPKKEEAEEVSREVAKVSQQYLAGRLIVIGIVAVINSVGLTLIGIKQGIFFGVLAAFLDLIPYIGIIIGAGLPLIASLINNEALWPFFAVLGLFVFVQLLENYYLTPKIVGTKVRLNPLFTIMAVLVGGYLWGVAGMILFIPFLGMLKVIFDHVEPLNPYGYLIGDPENRTDKSDALR
ncbi:AI-2E family transporter [Nafulsella turpanensis]|uniref:AI-2E family transporter n=1 Tax=Nafulsella turpanensis TaxID=1265690 RepID=UPI00126904DE|nr:AI-2E family transporter [Nafulsella turpanensis]